MVQTRLPSYGLSQRIESLRVQMCGWMRRAPSGVGKETKGPGLEELEGDFELGKAQRFASRCAASLIRCSIVGQVKGKNRAIGVRGRENRGRNEIQRQGATADSSNCLSGV